MSHSENKPKTTQTSSTTVTNINFQDTEGVNVAGDGNVITTTDQGTVAAAADIAMESLRAADESQRGARELIGRTVDDAFAFGTDAFYYGSDLVDRASERAINAVDVASDRSLTFGRDVLSETGGLIRGVFADAIDTVTGVLAEGQAQVGASLTNINEIARQQSTSDAERVQSIATTALYVGAGVVALVVLMQVWRS